MALVEFAYINSYQSTIGLEHYEALHERRCQSPIHWKEVEERKILITNTILWMEDTIDKVNLIGQRMTTTQDRQKSYAENYYKDLEFLEEDKVFLKVLPKKGIIKHINGSKLSPRYVGPFDVGPFEILKWIGKVA